MIDILVALRPPWRSNAYGTQEDAPVGSAIQNIVAKMMIMSSFPSMRDERKHERVTRALTDGLATEGVCCVAEGELADDRADVGRGLEEALEARGDGVAAVEPVLEHGSYGLVVVA